MRSTVFITACIALLSTPDYSVAKVIDLTDSTFEHQTQASTGQTTGKWFVKFYAPWCGHCKSLAPVWEDLDERVQENNPQDGILLAKVDATKEIDVAKRFMIQSYPTLKYFADRKMYNYKGPRTIDALYEFITEGYKAAVAENSIPPAPSVFQRKMKDLRLKFEKLALNNKHLTYLLDDFDHIISMRKNAAAVLLAMGAFVGFLCGVILMLLMVGNKSTESKKKKTKTN